MSALAPTTDIFQRGRQSPLSANSGRFSFRNPNGDCADKAAVDWTWQMSEYELADGLCIDKTSSDQFRLTSGLLILEVHNG